MSAVLSVYDAKTHFSSIAKQVENGATFTVTRHGKPVMVMSPIATEAREEEANEKEARDAKRRAAVERILARHKDPAWPRVSQAEWKEWINEGRR